MSDHRVSDGASDDTDEDAGQEAGTEAGDERQTDGAAKAADRITVADLRIEADLDLAVDGEPVRIRTGNGRVGVFVDRIGTLSRVAELLDALPEPLGGSLDRVPLGVHVAGVEVARVDPGVAAGPLSRALGVAPARVDLGGVVRAVLSRRD